jgi:hypothetical protein
MEEINLQEFAANIIAHIRNSPFPERELVAQEFEETLNTVFHYYQTERDEGDFKRSEFEEEFPPRSSRPLRQDFLFPDKYRKYSDYSKERTAILATVFEVFIVPMTLETAIAGFRFKQPIKLIVFEHGIAFTQQDFIPDYRPLFETVGKLLFPNIFDIKDFVNNATTS